MQMRLKRGIDALASQRGCFKEVCFTKTDLSHKDPEIPNIQNSFQMLQQVCLRDLLSKLIGCWIVEVDFNLQ